MNKEWLIINLEEAKYWIENAIKEIDSLDDDDDSVAQGLVGEAYIKMNYAWNSRKGPEPEGTHDQDYIKYPKEMDIYVG